MSKSITKVGGAVMGIWEMLIIYIVFSITVIARYHKALPHHQLIEWKFIEWKFIE